MIEEKVTVKLKGGLQTRPPALFVQEANRFNSTIKLDKNGSVVNAKSIMGIMSLAVGHDEELMLSVNGPDETEAMEQLKTFLDREKI
ncbi:MAG: HPr family phosphocarrier protein [Tuberibacillus sp.]